MNRKPRLSAYGIITDSSHEAVLTVVQKTGPFADTIGFPGGGIKYGENLKDGLRREIREETGLSDSDYNIDRPPYDTADYIDADRNMHLVGIYYLGRLATLGLPPLQQSHGGLWLPIDSLPTTDFSPLSAEVARRFVNEFGNVGS